MIARLCRLSMGTITTVVQACHPQPLDEIYLQIHIHDIRTNGRCWIEDANNPARRVDDDQITRGYN